MPMIPMEPAKAVIRVRPRLVIRLLSERRSAVLKPMEVLSPRCAGFSTNS